MNFFGVTYQLFIITWSSFKNLAHGNERFSKPCRVDGFLFLLHHWVSHVSEWYSWNSTITFTSCNSSFELLKQNFPCWRNGIIPHKNNLLAHVNIHVGVCTAILLSTFSLIEFNDNKLLLKEVLKLFYLFSLVLFSVL